MATFGVFDDSSIDVCLQARIVTDRASMEFTFRQVQVVGKLLEPTGSGDHGKGATKVLRNSASGSEIQHKKNMMEYST